MELGGAAMEEEAVVKNNDYFSKWLGPVFVGAYTAFASQPVFDGTVSMGMFLATIQIFQELSVDYGEVYILMMKMASVFDPLKAYTVVLNLPTDVPTWMEVSRKRRTMTREARELALKQLAVAAPSEDGVYVPAVDTLDLTFKDVTFRYGTGPDIFTKVSLTVRQGQMVAVQGNSGSGRRTFLQVLAHKIFPAAGDLFVPSHLRILFVSQKVYILGLSCWENITFGCGPQVDKALVLHLMDVLEMRNATIMVNADLAREEVAKASAAAAGVVHPSDADNPEGGHEPPKGKPDKKIPKVDKLSTSESAKIHLVRALLMNPEILILARPLSHFDNADQKGRILRILRDMVELRGIGLDPQTVHRRRPRTVFLIPESDEEAQFADMVLEIDGVRKDITTHNITGLDVAKTMFARSLPSKDHIEKISRSTKARGCMF
jgi:ATPase subunit of ABC transporter with duplicated ATPase domains